MNNKNLEQNLSKLKSVSLSTNEREVLRFKIDTAIKNKTYLFDTKVESKLSLIKIFGALATPAFLFVITFASAAASLPGDSIYSVKTNLNEPLQRLTVFGENNKLEFEKKLILKRVDEAKQLRNKGLLDVVVAKDIEAQITKQTNNVIQKSEKNVTDDSNSAAEKSSEAVALAEIKGTAVGGIGAIKVLSGQVIESEEGTDVENPSDKIDEITTQPAQVAESKNPRTLPSVKKTLIQAEAQATTAKAKAVKEAANNEPTAAKESPEVAAFTNVKLNSAIETSQKSAEIVDEEDLVKAVEDSTAVIVLTEALKNTK